MHPAKDCTIPYASIDTVFLDVGNTLISMDFDWIAAELSARGVATDAATVRRAEAAARPGYSRRMFIDGMPAGTDVFRVLLTEMVGGIPAAALLAPAAFETLISELRQALRPDGRASVLWRSVMPRVPEALARMQALGLQLVAVSNSDGTAEQSLVDAGLRAYLTRVIDSAIAGYEKPDPRIFTEALRLSGATAARTLHVGDLYHADVTGARAAGVHVVMLDPHRDWQDVDCERAADLWDVAGRLAASR
jgi:FMN phosphatase YigB (HAD superfamily)